MNNPSLAVTDRPADVLAAICRDTRAEVEARKAKRPIESMRSAAASAPKPRGFARALMEATVSGRFGLIAEIKKASPSGGLIRPDFHPAALARGYAAGGANCLSVLTDAKHFQGSPEHVKIVRAAVDLPILRKDFILDPWQVYESRAMGADCILMIMAALENDQAVEIEHLARALDLDVLVEVHDGNELQRALGMQTKLIGINARNLKTLKTDLAVVEEIAPHVPPDRFIIAESGLRTHDDLERMAKSVGIRAFLVGESLLRQPDVEAATRALLWG
ncbi:MAG TPA: indole-3-glycerol phosphate synthase TrpC [Acetobacteraceae bacterium]|jgi:indole-3-glycerol phosphate synthase|nr:indole-3-glycerol phosphate synthase TrpC [Acetobacteraceae bacterium]